MDELNEERMVMGNMDSDSDLSTIQNPNIIESHNTRVGVNGSNTQRSRTPILGNDLPFVLESNYVVQDKIIRLLPNASILDGNNHDLIFDIFNRASPTPAGVHITATFNGTSLANFKTYFDVLLTGFGYTYTSAVRASYGAVEYSFSTEDCIISTPNSQYEIVIYTARELLTAYDIGGTLKPIAIESVGDYVYVWSCLRDTEPTVGYAIGEIGRATYDENYGIWNYVRLVGSKELNFLTTKQPDNPKIEKNDYRYSLYWTDKFNPPKALYANTLNSKFSLDATATILTADNKSVDLSKIFTLDNDAKVKVCGEERRITSVDNTNKTITVSPAFSQQFLSTYVDLQDISLDYRYQTGYGLNYDYIKSETDQFPVTRNVEVEFLEVILGGSVTSGNKRYIARGVSADLVEYGWSRISRVVPITSAKPNPLSVGDLRNINSGKAVSLRINNIDNNIFKYVDLGVINYSGSFPSAEFVKRVEVGSSSVDITHIGSENGGIIDLNTITDASIYFDYAATNEIISNRNILGNVKVVQPRNYAEFCLGVTHTIARNILPNTPTTIGSGTLMYGEYMNPQNVFGFGSAVVNETYRVGFRITETNGAVSDWWVDDIRIDTDTFNITYNTIYNGSTLPNRRTATVADLDLTDGNYNPYYYYITFAPDWTITVDGLDPRDIIKSIEVVFANVEREVLSCGMAIPSTTFYTDGVPLPANFFRPWNLLANTFELWLNRENCICHFPDVLLGQTDINFVSGDQLWVFGRQTPRADITLANFYRYQLYSGDMSTGGITSTMQKLGINDAKIIQKSGQITLGTGGVSYFQNISGTSGVTPSVWVPESGIAIKFNTGQTIDANGIVSDTTPFYYVQYVRPQVYVNPDNCKYSTVATTTYYPCGNPPAYINYGVASITGIVNDSFIQSFHLKELYPVKQTGVYTTTTNGFGATFYCQNIANSQMRAWTPDNINLRLFPNSFARLSPDEAVKLWLSYWWVDGTTVIQDEFSYDPSYSYNSGLQPEIGQDPELPIATVSTTGIYWTDKKPQNSVSDPYRRALAGNVHYLDAVDGEIVDMFEFGTELYVNQEYNTRRLFYNETGQLQTAPNLSVIVGDGSVMGRDGYSITKFGSSHQQSNIYGISENGNDIRYWFDKINNKIVRFGGNGVDPISDTKNLNADTRLKTKWASLFTSPAYSYGVHGTFDMRNREMLMTFRGQKIVDDFNLGYYTIGDVVADTTPYDLNFYSLPKTLYKAKVTGVLSPPTGADDDPNWLFVPLTDTDYYSWITFVYSEITKGFSTYYDFVPKLYGKYKTTFLTPRPVLNTQNYIYVHNRGNYCEWWNIDGNKFTAYPTVTVPFNVEPDETKKWVYIKVDTNENPYRADFTCVDDGKISYLTESEFKQRRDMWVSPIKNDATVSVDNPSGLNSIHTGGLRSKVLRVLYNLGSSQVQPILRRIFIKSRLLDKKTKA